ncbi:MAG: ATP-binding protein [Actinomycetota bacterium]
MTTLVTEVRMPAPGSPVDASAYARAILNILEDFSEEKARLASTHRALLNILEDFSEEKARLASTHRALLNILGDFADEKSRLSDTQRAVLNILEDFDLEKRKVAELEMFAYVASHDLQEPLRMVTSYTQLLAKRYAGRLDADADDFIGFVVDGTKRMQALIRDLLEYSRVGSAELNLRATDCEQVLQGVLASLKNLIAESGAIVTYDPLPTVLADSSQLTQLFQNLVTNAVKFHGERSPVVHVGVEPTAGSWRLSVRDNGIGMDPAYTESVFEAFRRLNPRDYPGTGVGLAICKKIVERHGGRIWVESAVGEGSVFFVTLSAAP